MAPVVLILEARDQLAQQAEAGGHDARGIARKCTPSVSTRTVMLTASVPRSEVVSQSWS